MTSARARILPWLVAAFFYSALALILTWPLAARMTTVLPHDLGDPALNTWILWWNAHAVPFTTRWWNGPMFWPASGALALSEHLLGISLVATPLQWIGASPVMAYNVMFLLTFPLSALAAHALTFALTERHDAAVVAGLVFGFNPFRVAHFPQLQVLTSYWMPLALLALHRYLERRDARWLLVFGGAWLLQALSNGYYLLFFPVLLALWVAWFVRTEVRSIAAILAAWAIASLPLVPILWGYRRIHAALDLRRGYGEAEFFGADLTALLDAAPLLKFWKLSAFHRPEGELFPGATAFALVAILVGVGVATSPRPVTTSRAFRAFLLLGLVLIAVAVSPIVFGPWSITIAGVKLLSVAVSSKPLSLGLLAFFIALTLEPRVAAAWRSRSAVKFYVFAMLAMYLLSFGPRARFLGATFIYEAPYKWLMSMPGFDSVRVPARFAMLAIVCLSVAAGMAFARLTDRLRARVRALAFAVVVAGVLADSWIGALPLPSVHPRLAALESLPAGTAVMELPLGGADEDTAAMSRSMYHRHPIVNGYSGFFPRHYDILHYALDAGDDAAIGGMATFGPIAVAVGSDRGADRFASALARRAGVVSLGVDADRKMFLVPAAPPLRETPIGERLHVQAVSANGSLVDATPLSDGDLRSRWHSGAPQRGGETVTIDLGSIKAVDMVMLSLGPYIGDYPQMLAIEMSEDGATWSSSWSGRGAAYAVVGAVRNPREVPLTFPLEPTRARFIRLRQLGKDAEHHWSIAELAVYGA